MMSWPDAVHVYDYAEYRHKNAVLAAAILALPAEAYARRSHFFHGRYENLYLNAAILPELEPLLATALVKAAQLLQRPAATLKLGFWLNIMQRGDITTLHSHDDDDELLSAVYYVQVPDDAGVFKIYQQGEACEISPVAGRFMFFPPSALHEVSEHRNDIPRISIGINIGPVSE